MLFMLALMRRMRRGEWIVILVTMGIAIVNWLWAQRRVAHRGNFHEGM
jgi:hypothetical protein